MIKFSSNPILFKIRYLNNDRFETTTNISAVLGQAFHKAMEAFYESADRTQGNLQDAVAYGLAVGMEFLEQYEEGFINYSKTIATRQVAMDKLAFSYNAYIQELADPNEDVLACEDEINEQIHINWRGENLVMPVPLKGYLDKVFRDASGKLKIVDYKTCASFSDPERIDGAKILQAAEYYFLAHAKYGEEPYSITFQEVKHSKNRDGTSQVREYEVVYAENDLYFDFYLRLYTDIIRALNGEQVYVPNVHSLFDNEVAIVAYIQRLDVEEEVARRMHEEQVTTITELLKKDIQRTATMNGLQKMLESSFMEAKNIDYTTMKNEEKIQTKLMEHGMMLRFNGVTHGASVDLYSYVPSMGLKMSRLRNYIKDIELALGISGVRVLAPIPNSTLVGFEIPKQQRTFPSVPKGSGYDIAIGQDVMGADVRFDLREAPHMLVAGASGSGKSVFLNAVIEQLARIKGVELMFLDPKRVELAQHKSKGIYLNTVPDIIEGLAELVEEMEERYKYIEKQGKKSIVGTDLPYKFVILDEFGEIAIAKTGKDMPSGMDYVLRLAQMARASGIHLIIATQRPSVDIITGTIKANFPVKVAFKTAKASDSRVILDDQGAEMLLGKGDMLFQAGATIERLQGYLTE